MLKEIALLRRATGSDRQTWQGELRAVLEEAAGGHGALGITRQILDLPIVSSDPAAVGASADYDAVIETWIDGPPAALDERAAFEAAAPSVRALVDASRTTLLLVREVVIGAPREGGYKIISFVRRSATLHGDTFYDYWKNTHGPLIRSVTEFWRHVRGYVQNHPAAPARTLAPGTPDAYDGITQLWFDSDAEAVRAFSEPRYLSVIRADELILRSGLPHRLIAREIPIVPR